MLELVVATHLYNTTVLDNQATLITDISIAYSTSIQYQPASLYQDFGIGMLVRYEVIVSVAPDVMVISRSIVCGVVKDLSLVTNKGDLLCGPISCR